MGFESSGMEFTSFHEKQALGFFDADLGAGLLDYAGGEGEDYAVITHQGQCSDGTALELTPLDLMMPHNWMPFTYAFENSSNVPDFMSAAKLKESLSQALGKVPALAGRLESSTAMNFMSPKEPTRVLLNNKGAWFCTAEMKTPFECMRRDHFGKSLLPSQFIFNSFTKAAIQGRDSNVDVPLLAAKAVYFGCGSVVLTVYINHLVCDGRSMYEFVRLWGQLNRGLTPDPLIESRQAILDIPKLSPTEAEMVQGLFMSAAPYQPCISDMQMCTVSIKDSLLRELKDEINAKLGPSWVSRDDLFVSVLGRMLHRARKTDVDPYCLRTVNIRKHLQLDNSAFGNFVGASFEGPLQSMLDQSIQPVAKQTRERLAKLDHDTVPKTIQALLSVDLKHLPDANQNMDAARDLGSTSLAAHDLTRVDFHNSPAIYSFACYYINGALTVNPIFDGHYNGCIGVDLAYLDDFVNDPEARDLGFTVTPMKKLLFK